MRQDEKPGEKTENFIEKLLWLDINDKSKKIKNK